MYYQSYEEYMKDVLGYPRNAQIPSSTYNNLYMNQPRNQEMQDEDVQNMYPEIYKIAYPMVCKVCNQYRGEITEDLVNRLTDEVYSNLEIEDIEIAKEKTEIRNSGNNQISKMKVEQKKPEIEKRQSITNNTLRDLIKILIIRELLNRQRRPGRPPFPNRPPFPGGPTPRPPMPRVSQVPPYGIESRILW